MSLTSKTRTVISRFPDFYQSEDSANLLVQFLDVFGHVLEQLEADILRVMRSHWVDTASNAGSEGFDRVRKGDLDRIFAFYLENLGGTSQLKQVNWNFVAQDFTNLAGLVEKLRQPQNPVSKYLQEQFSPETRRLLAEHQFARGELVLARALDVGELIIPAELPLMLLRRTGADVVETRQFVTTHSAVFQHRVSAVTVTVQSSTAGSTYEVTNLTRQVWRVAADDPALRALEIYNPQPFRNQGQVVLERRTGAGELVVPVATRLTLLRQSGPDAGQNSDFETTQDARFPANVRTVEVTVRQTPTANNTYAYVAATSQTWRVESDDPALAALKAHNPQPLRLQTDALQQALIEELNQILQQPLYDNDRFAQVALSEEIQALVREQPQAGRALAHFNYALLEAAYPTAIARSYAAYRERLRGVISVLLGGASTVAGITDIVAVNLGITGDSAAARTAKQQIRVVEFLPQPATIEHQGAYGQGLALREPFVLENPNQIDVQPEIRLHIHPGLFRSLINPRLVNLATGAFVQYRGTVTRNDVLTFAPDGSGFLNGRRLAPGALVGAVPPLPPGTSRWQLEAATGVAEAHFDQTRFDAAAFEQERLDDQALSGPGHGEIHPDHSRFDAPGAQFDTTVFVDPLPVIAAIAVNFERLTPGAFTVRIPWDIPGFTDKFAEFDDHPRHQIKYIIEKVKAAGILAAIAYEKRFTEEHALADQLRLHAMQRKTEEHPASETAPKLALTYTPDATEGGIRHEISEALVTSAVFDHTRLDQSVFWDYKPGVFDQTRFERGNFWSRPGVFDETAFDQVEFGFQPGVFGSSHFDQVGFDPITGQFGRAAFDAATFVAAAGWFDTGRFDQAGFDLENTGS